MTVPPLGPGGNAGHRPRGGRCVMLLSVSGSLCLEPEGLGDLAPTRGRRGARRGPARGLAGEEDACPAVQGSGAGVLSLVQRVRAWLPAPEHLAGKHGAGHHPDPFWTVTLGPCAATARAAQPPAGLLVPVLPLLGQLLPLPKGLGFFFFLGAGQEQPPSSRVAAGDARHCGTRGWPPLPWLRPQTGRLQRRYLYPRGRQASCAASPAARGTGDL